MKRFHARVAVVKALQDAGLYIETKDNPMQIPICSKSGDIIEPLLKPQWYVNCKPLAEEALRVSATLCILLSRFQTMFTSAHELASCLSPRNHPRTNGTAGSKEFRIGVFLASFGGVTDVLRTSCA